MTHIDPSDTRRLKLYVLELRAELNRVEESIAQMQHRASELLGMFQQEFEGRSERMYRDLERAIVNGRGDAPADAPHPPAVDDAAALPRTAAVPHLRAVPSLMVARKSMSQP
ncbi:MAG: hypothetical protein REJ24_03325 [Rhodocyclaceae bacterium]|nr:hypothetical protein [Rhodocyclaceae bacterium]